MRAGVFFRTKPTRIRPKITPLRPAAAAAQSRRSPQRKTPELFMPLTTLNSLQKFKVGRKTAQFYSLPALGEALGIDIQRLPVSIRIVLESVLRNCDGKKITEKHVRQLAGWKPRAKR